MKVDTRRSLIDISDRLYDHALAAEFLADHVEPIIHVRHDQLSNENYNFMVVTRDNPTTRPLLDILTQAGYYIYGVNQYTTSFVHDSRIDDVWPDVATKKIQRTDEGVLFRIEEAKSGNSESLLVVLSSMAGGLYQTDISRYFHPNFPTIAKYLPENTTILRIGDLGGVKGAFYLPTAFKPSRPAATARLIRDTANERGIPASRIVLYGASKGATGAVALGLSGNLSFLAVDPILSDRFYEEQRNDLHFTTGGIFPSTKETYFSRLLDSSGGYQHVPVFISSPNSEQFSSVRDFADRLGPTSTLLISKNPSIAHHPDVGARTVHMQTSVLNFMLSGFHLETGRMTFN
ncbi:MAG: XcbB/CpsF family capsular polysaccharide biosynthesis protein [Actinobacteria bacterium]|nr:XcbB/CpsF family capsular polysaccharide biosynthesis protein [Actinomycetota bacterium]